MYKKNIQNWELKGCFKDDNTRVIPHYLGLVSSKEECQKLAEAKDYNTIGLQAGSQCFGGESPAYDKLGSAGTCANMGGSWT